MNKNRPTPRHIQMKFHNTEEEKELLRTLREFKKKKLYKIERISMALNFSIVTRKLSNALKTLKENIF